MRLRATTNHPRLAVGLVIAASATLVVLASGSSGAPRAQATAGPSVPAVAAAFLPVVEAGLPPSGLRQTYTLPSGVSVDTIRGTGQSCFVLMNDGAHGNNGNCGSAAAADSGQVVSVFGHCNADGTGVVRVVGLVAAGVVGGTLDHADGAVMQRAAAGGVLAFEDVVRPGYSAPVSVHWLSLDGRVIRSVPLPGIPPGACAPVLSTS